MPSTIMNIVDLLADYKNVVSVNPDISTLYIMYQVGHLKIIIIMYILQTITFTFYQGKWSEALTFRNVLNSSHI